MTRFLMLLSATASSVLLAWSGCKYHEAAEEAEAVRATAIAVAEQTTELKRLQGLAPPELHNSRPAPGIASRIAQVVSVAGIASASLRSVMPEIETGVHGISGNEYRRTFVRFTLDSVTLPELGQFLREWRNASPEWSVSQIDLAHGNAEVRSDQARMRVTMLAESVFARDH